MVLLACLCALSSAVLNAGWNILLRGEEDPLRTSTQAMSIACVVLSPLLLVVWLASGMPALPWQALAAAMLSGLLELGYFIFLSAAYRRGELATLYPVARGTAPLLAACAGVLVLHETLHPIVIGGIVMLIAGIWMVRGTSGGGLSVTAPALATGVCIAAYSTVDSAGTHLVAPWFYAWLLWCCSAGWLQGWSAMRRRCARIAWRFDLRGVLQPRTVAISLLMTTAYWLVLVAFRLAPLAIVAPLRESSVLIVAGWSVIRMKDRAQLVLRLGGACAIVVGILLLVV